MKDLVKSDDREGSKVWNWTSIFLVSKFLAHNLTRKVVCDCMGNKGYSKESKKFISVHTSTKDWREIARRRE